MILSLYKNYVTIIHSKQTFNNECGLSIFAVIQKTENDGKSGVKQI